MILVPRIRITDKKNILENNIEKSMMIKNLISFIPQSMNHKWGFICYVQQLFVLFKIWLNNRSSRCQLYLRVMSCHGLSRMFVHECFQNSLSMQMSVVNVYKDSSGNLANSSFHFNYKVTTKHISELTEYISWGPRGVSLRNSLKKDPDRKCCLSRTK